MVASDILMFGQGFKDILLEFFGAIFQNSLDAFVRVVRMVLIGGLFSLVMIPFQIRKSAEGV